MGNICSRDICSRNQSENFNGPGRIVGNVPTNAEPRASVPVERNRKTSEGRTLGSTTDGGDNGEEDPRTKAANAALVRTSQS